KTWGSERSTSNRQRKNRGGGRYLPYNFGRLRERDGPRLWRYAVIANHPRYKPDQLGDHCIHGPQRGRRRRQTTLEHADIRRSVYHDIFSAVVPRDQPYDDTAAEQHAA